MRCNLSIVLLWGLLLAGCHQAGDSPALSTPSPRFLLTVEGADVEGRSSLDAADAAGYRRVLWRAGDCVSIFPELNDNHEYQTQADGVNVAEFSRTQRPAISGNPPQSHGGVYYAVSPWHAENRVVDGVISLHLLAEQSAPADQPMPEVMLMSSVSDSEDLLLQNNVALLRFRFVQEGLDGLVVERIRITSETHLLAGRGVVNPQQAEPSIEIQPESASSKVITFRPEQPEAVKSAAEGYLSYYVAIAPGEYDDLLLEFETNKGRFVNNLSGSVVPCSRSKYFTLNKTFRPDELRGDTSTSTYEEGGVMEL